ncbi:hypothetical protein MTsPCn3_24150 [Erythrobacter sp. MTPC3]
MRACAIYAALLLPLTLSGCSLFEQKVEPPPRAQEPIAIPDGQSTFAANVEIPLSDLRRALERETPRRLWSINRPGAECVPPQRTEVIGIAIKSPTIRCDLKGRVTRGAMSLSGSGQDLIVTMPIQAEITAEEIAGIIESKTATARATVTARLRPAIQPDWAVTGRVRITYNWDQPPSVTLLGQRIEFAQQADERLGKVVRTLERTLEREIAKLDPKRAIQPVWQQGFTTLSLNRENPPVWLQLTPNKIGYDGHTVSRSSLSLKVRLAARTKVFVGDKPPSPSPVPLPDIDTSAFGQPRVSLTVPVIAQYSQLEPVLEKALRKRAARPFPVPEIGDWMVELKSVEAYGTEGNRVAVGVTFEAWPPDDRDNAATGTVWLTARPHNTKGSRVVEFMEPEYQAETSRFTTNVLLEIAKTQDFSDVIEDALTQNFESDYRALLEKIDAELADLRLGDFAVEAKLGEVNTGTLTAYGEGLLLPVSATGDAQIRYAPR